MDDNQEALPVLAPQAPNPAYPPIAAQDAVRALLSGAGNVASNIASIPQRAFESSENMRMGGGYNPAPVMEAAQLLMGGGMPAAEEGAAGVFGGMLSRTADLGKLQRAFRNEKGGASQLENFNDTGWYRGHEGRWKYEIPDTNISMEPYSGRGTGKMIDYLNHPELYKAYPDLKYVRVMHNMPEGYGEHMPGLSLNNEYIRVSPWGGDKRIETTLHELQHAIQSREAFSPGTTPKAMVEPTMQALQEYGYTKKSPEGKWMVGEKDIPSHLHPADIMYQAYGRTAGETEARNVEGRYRTRSIMPGARLPPPWETEDVNPMKQSVLPFEQIPLQYQQLLKKLIENR